MSAALSPPLNRRRLLFGGLMLGTAAVTFARLPRTEVVALRLDDLDSAVPETAGAWRWADGDDIVVPPETADRETAAYDKVLTRSYVNGAATIMLLIAYDSAQSGMLQIHRPEACYPASGYTLSGTADYSVPLAAGLSVPGQRLTATNGQRVEQILYWTRIGDDFPTSYDGQRASVAGQNLRGLIPDGALIRISTINRDAAAAQAALLGFAQQLFGGMDAEGRALMAGPISVARLARTA